MERCRDCGKPIEKAFSCPYNKRYGPVCPECCEECHNSEPFPCKEYDDRHEDDEDVPLSDTAVALGLFLGILLFIIRISTLRTEEINMHDFVTTLLAAVISTAITVATPYFVAFLKRKGTQAAEQAKNEKSKQYIAEATKAVTTAVTAVSQTYVDALKKENAFTKEAQTEALQKAKDTTLAIMSIEAKDFIAAAYDDLDTFLTAKIEEAVRVQKKDTPLVISATVE